jgi:dipeptidyl aminopeptidase/acylaminoacyl peptidase
MRRILPGMMAATLLAAAPVAAQQAEPVALPAYAAVKGLNHYADAATYAAAADDKRFRMERIAYQSDGITVYAYVYRPAKAGAARPTIVFNRGSWTWPSFAAEMLPMAHRMAEKGYVVVAPMYRGSGGAAGRDEMGGADLDDLFNLLPALRAMPFVDPAYLYLYGESRGGMMVYQALRDGFPAKAAAVYGGFTDLDSLLGDAQWAKAGEAIWPDLSTHRAAIVERRSALHWPEKISAPILIMQGGEDKSINPVQSLKMAEALSALGKPYELIIMAGEGHVLTGRAVERDDRTARWFADHAKMGAETGAKTGD